MSSRRNWELRAADINKGNHEDSKTPKKALKINLLRVFASSRCILSYRMPKTDPRIDAYIEKAADFAKPILKEIRTRVHAACPDCVETVKWSTPAFDYKGAMCGMAAFKAHCMFGFWKAPLVVGGRNPPRDDSGISRRLPTSRRRRKWRR